MSVQTEEILHRIEAKKYIQKEQMISFFDSLEAVQVEEMSGTWKGKEVLTGHSIEGLLDELGWFGKRFDHPDSVHPLLFESKNGKVLSINPVWFPMDRLIKRFDQGLKLDFLTGVARFLLPFFETVTGTARLRMVEFRGKATATMIYDKLPIHDHFRRIDDHTLLGWMDLKGQRQPYFFILYTF